MNSWFLVCDVQFEGVEGVDLRVILLQLFLLVDVLPTRGVEGLAVLGVWSHSLELGFLNLIRPPFWMDEVNFSVSPFSNCEFLLIWVTCGYRCSSHEPYALEQLTTHSYIGFENHIQLIDTAHIYDMRCLFFFKDVQKIQVFISRLQNHKNQKRTWRKWFDFIR